MGTDVKNPPLQGLDQTMTRQRVIRPVPAVGRAIGILRYLAKKDEPVGVNQVATDLKIVPSTCLHTLRALVEEGVVSVNQSTKQYSLGLGVLTLARQLLKQRGVLQVVQPELDRLAKRHGISIGLVERYTADELVVSAAAEGSDTFSVKISLGSVLPAFASASGRCIASASNLDDQQLQKIFETLQWQKPPSFESWLSDVRSVPSKGYAIDDGNMVRGLTIAAVPIPNSSGSVSACAASVAFSGWYASDRPQAMLDDLKAACSRIQLLFG